MCRLHAPTGPAVWKTLQVDQPDSECIQQSLWWCIVMFCVHRNDHLIRLVNSILSPRHLLSFSHFSNFKRVLLTDVVSHEYYNRDKYAITCKHIVKPKKKIFYVRFFFSDWWNTKHGVPVFIFFCTYLFEGPVCHAWPDRPCVHTPHRNVFATNIA